MAAVMAATTEPIGALCIVLHGHLPYVLHHGTFPHGESWLFEAAAESYLPLLDMIDEVVRHNSAPRSRSASRPCCWNNSPMTVSRPVSSRT